MLTIIGNDVHMIRGDTEQLVVTCQFSDGTERPFEAGDTVTLTVAWPMGPTVLQKSSEMAEIVDTLSTIFLLS